MSFYPLKRCGEKRPRHSLPPHPEMTAAGHMAHWAKASSPIKAMFSQTLRLLSVITITLTLALASVPALSLANSADGTNPDAPRPNYEAQSAYFGDSRNKTAFVPVEATNTELAFKYSFRGDEEWVSASELLVVNENIYLAYKQTLDVIDGSSGEVIASAKLAYETGYASRLVYVNGMVVVPLQEGRLQAFTADTLTCLWISEPVGENHQVLTSLVAYREGIYFGTAVASASQTSGGAFVCLNDSTGETVWRYDNPEVGYYGTGAAFISDVLYVADDSGTIISLNALSGLETSRINLGVSVRSALLAAQLQDSNSHFLYLADVSGNLWKIAVDDNLALIQPLPKEDNRIKFAESSTVMPVLAKDRLYAVGNTDGRGLLAVVDIAQFAIEQEIELGDNVGSTPFVLSLYDKDYVLITENAPPGSLLICKVDDGSTKALYSPSGDDSNYCLGTVVSSDKGMLYYTNDSGVLFGLREKMDGSSERLPSTTVDEQNSTTSFVQEPLFKFTPVDFLIFNFVAACVFIALLPLLIFLVWYFAIGKRRKPKP